MADKEHALGVQDGGLAVDVKAAHFSGSEFENGFFRVLERFFTKKGDEFLFHGDGPYGLKDDVGFGFPTGCLRFSETCQESVDFILIIRV
jgi:hypothetical protein